jgi:hypothetical protein
MSKYRKQMIKELLDGFGLSILEWDEAEIADAVQYLSFMDQKAFNELLIEQQFES